MSAIGSIPLEPLEKIYEGVSLPGPCITLLLPPHHPGDGSGSSVNYLRTALREAAEQLNERRVPQPIRAELRAPLETLAADPALHAGSKWGRVVMRCPD